MFTSPLRVILWDNKKLMDQWIPHMYVLLSTQVMTRYGDPAVLVTNAKVITISSSKVLDIFWSISFSLLICVTALGLDLLCSTLYHCFISMLQSYLYCLWAITGEYIQTIKDGYILGHYK